MYCILGEYIKFYTFSSDFLADYYIFSSDFRLQRYVFCTALVNNYESLGRSGGKKALPGMAGLLHDEDFA